MVTTDQGASEKEEIPGLVGRAGDKLADDEVSNVIKHKQVDLGALMQTGVSTVTQM